MNHWSLLQNTNNAIESRGIQLCDDHCTDCCSKHHDRQTDACNCCTDGPITTLMATIAALITVTIGAVSVL